MMSAADIVFFRKWVYEQSGIVLSEDKDYLIRTRMATLLRQCKMDDFTQIVQRIKQRDQEFCLAVVDAMTTNETLFFRDVNLWKALASDVIPNYVRENRDRQKMRVWSAACSTGQEICTFVMHWKELVRTAMPQLLRWKLEIEASDLSSEALERAKEACYRENEIKRGLTDEMRDRYFKKVGDDWQFDKKLLETVKYQQLNLVRVLPQREEFDMIFIRNVLIYFDEKTVVEILRRVVRQLRPGGFLFVGGTESVPADQVGLERVRFGMSWGLVKK